MKHFPEGISFKYPWRKYQERVLSELDEHLTDNHLHIIAPPGSGKTVLGLEVALRLNKPTLIFAPTLAIRNQWIQRFCELFLQTNKTPDWISGNIKNPAFFTVTTYQALHAAFSGSSSELEESEKEEEEEEDITIEEDHNTPELTRAGHSIEIVQKLIDQNIGTLVVDEAHHLTRAWWQSLTELKNTLAPTVVGLTATPPYDLAYNEWQRYIELNGPVDTEISVPELVTEGDLCPHQDYIYFSRPTIDEYDKIEKLKTKIKQVYEDTKNDATLIEAIENQIIYLKPLENLEWIYGNLQEYSATLIFLHAHGREITTDHLEIIGDKYFTIPSLNYEWFEILLSYYLHHENFTLHDDHRLKLSNKLRRNGVLERKTIRFDHNRKVNSYLSSSLSKLRSIETIVNFEYDQLKSNLRMVVLTDFIRKEFLTDKIDSNFSINKIGVIPIFQRLRVANRSEIRLGVLTGSIVILPVSALEIFNKLSNVYGLGSVNAQPLSFDPEFVIINSTGDIKDNIVHIVTQIFELGEIEVLIGTKSLLGEGWDAPSINALILASFVGSYVLSNQMRGRAIRTERTNKNKSANIWHLVCIDPTSDYGGDDLALMRRRFKAFVGISVREEVSIENGISRLDLPLNLRSNKEIESVNDQMLRNASERSKVSNKWRIALETGSILIEEIKVPFPEKKDYIQLKGFYYNKTIKYLASALISGLLYYFFMVIESFGRIGRILSTQDLLVWLAFVVLFMIFIFGGLAFKTFKTYVKYRDISDDIKNIGTALVESLSNVGAMQTPLNKLSVDAHVDRYGAIYCHLDGGTTFERSTFLACLQEIVGPLENPRYIILRKSKFLDILSQTDYHAVPEPIGRRKNMAEFFEKSWDNHVGRCELVYTRTLDGRKLLLRGRMNSLAAQFENKSERVNLWR